VKNSCRIITAPQTGIAASHLVTLPHKRTIRFLKRPDRRDLLDNASRHVSSLLESYLGQASKKSALELTPRAGQLKASRFQPMEVLEGRLLQKNRMRLFIDSYFNSVRRDLRTDYRKMRNKIDQKKIANVFSDEFLRRVLLRPEDFNYKIMPYEEAFLHFKKVAAQEFGAHKRRHKQWHKQFRSLPTFFPLREGPDLMRNMQTT
jgi:hypothetical protein